MILILEKYKDVLTINDICEILKIGRNTAYKLLQNNDIPNRKIASKYIIPKTAIIDFLTNIAA